MRIRGDCLVLFMAATLVLISTPAFAGGAGTGALSRPTGARGQGDQRRDAERAWNERLRQAKAKVRDLGRQADQTELEVNRRRNMLFSGERRTAQTQNRLAERIAERGKQLLQLRQEAMTAGDEVDAIVAEGDGEGFRVEVQHEFDYGGADARSRRCVEPAFTSGG